jgi:hypothetical protein
LNVPVAIKGFDGAQVLELVGLGDVLPWLEANGIEMFVGYNSLVFRKVKGKQLAWAPCKLAVLHKLKAGTLDEDALAELRGQIKATIVGIKEGGEMATLGALALLKAPKPKEDVIEPEAATAPDPPAQATVIFKGSWPIFPPSEMMNAEPVKLRDATQMYQPVRGSSPNSRYFLVGANEHLRIAARFKGGSLSVRIEGPEWEQHKEQISSCGFDNISLQKGYASLHLAVANPTVAAKALGAVLLGLGVTLTTPLPELAVIKDLGL